jgi:cytochrome c553
MKQFLLGAVSVILLGAIAGFGYIQNGGVDFAADTAHSESVTNLIAWAREQSINKRAKDIAPPADLANGERIRRGAGNYEAMCAGCHLSPGTEDSEIRKGLYPVPPNLSLPAATPDASGSDGRLFWIIKHGIKGSAMPAWAKSGMDDETIWDLTAFIRALPKLSANEYQASLAASEGHSHAGMAPEPAAQQPAQGHSHEGHTHTNHKHSH